MRDGVIGSTADSDSVSRGSSPFPVAFEESMKIDSFFVAMHTTKRSSGPFLVRKQ